VARRGPRAHRRARAPRGGGVLGVGPRRVDPRATRPGARVARRGRSRARRRAQPAGVLGRADGAARLRAGGRVAHRPHSDGGVDPVGAGRARRRHVQGGRRAARALRREGRDRGQEG